MDKQISDLRLKTISGVRWSAIARFVQQLLSFLTIAILAHLLSPSAFGVVGMTFVVINFVEVFRDLGTSAVLIQRKEISRELISTLFWMNLLLGFLFALIIIGIAPLAAIFFREPKITMILRIMSISFVLTGLSVIPEALLVREMLFRKLAYIENTSFLFGAVIGVGMALSGWGVWSLVMQSLTRTLSMGIILWLSNPFSPQQDFFLKSLRSIASYSLNLSGFNLLNYFIRNADNMLIGRYLGSTPLGFYELAYKWIFFPIYQISGVVGRVFFPAFSKLQNDNMKFCEVYLRLCSSIGIVTFPLLLGMAGLAKPLILVTLGHKWAPIIPLLIILSPVGILQSIGTTVGHIYLAKGKTDLMFLWGCASGALYISFFAIGLKWGIIGVAVAYGIGTLIVFYPSLVIPFKLINLPILYLGRVLWRPLMASLLMLMAILGLKFTLLVNLANGLVLSILILTGAFVYLVASWLINRLQLREIMGLIWKN